MKLSWIAREGRAICSLVCRRCRLKRDIPGESVFARSSVAFMVVTEKTEDGFGEETSSRGRWRQWWLLSKEKDGSGGRGLGQGNNRPRALASLSIRRLRPLTSVSACLSFVLILFFHHAHIASPFSTSLATASIHGQPT